jgi:ABC-2 type transport system ATP-binding protein
MISLQQFEKLYGRLRAVSSLDLEVRAGEAFALLGSNGSGKTTILRAIAGLHFPSSGRVLVDGIDVRRDPVRARERIGYLPQRVTLPGLLTGREQLEFYAGLNGVSAVKVEEALEFIRLTDDADRQTREYSGGMVQRLGLGIAYLREAPVLLLDEPTLNLDPTGLGGFREWIHGLRERGTTILFASHLLHEALRLADRVGVMSEGRLVRVEEISGFRDKVVAATMVRVVLDRLDDSIVVAARAAGAVKDSRSEDGYTFEAPPRARQKVIRAIEAAGCVIEELHTEPPDWESLVENHLRREV